MTNEQLRMQMLSGIITEGEYKAKLEEKASLNESMIGGIVGVGAITQIPATPKTDYEMAFEHFLGERYEVKPNRERDDINEEDTVEDMEARTAAEVNEGRTDEFRNLLEKVYEDAVENVEYDEMHGYSSKPFNDYWNENRGELSALLSKL